MPYQMDSNGSDNTILLDVQVTNPITVNNFKQLIHVLNGITAETNIKFIGPNEKHPGGIKLDIANNTMNDYSTILVSIDLSVSKFFKYTCNQDELLIGINVNQLLNFLDSLRAYDFLSINIDKQDRQYINFEINDLKHKMVSESKIKMKILQVEQPNMVFPNSITFNTCITMLTTVFNNICHDILRSTNGNTIKIKCSSNMISFSSKGNNDGEVKIKIIVTNGKQSTRITKENKYGVTTTNYESNNGYPISIVYDYQNTSISAVTSLNDISLFSKCASMSNTMNIYMKKGYPMVISYTIPNLGRMSVCFAPLNDMTIEI